MADQKVAKNTSKPASAKSEKTKASKANLSLPEQVTAKRADLLNARKGLYDGTLQNPHAIKAIKKDIARLLTKINQEKGAK